MENALDRMYPGLVGRAEASLLKTETGDLAHNITIQQLDDDRLGQIDPTLASPNAGGRLGAIQYANTCNCDSYKSAYPMLLVRGRRGISNRSQDRASRRTLMPAPSTSVSPQIAPSRNNLGIYTSGFGIINAYLAPGTGYASPTQATNFALQPRSGTIIARFSF
ncbi:MAG TPA: hypothetical protein VKV74_08045 [Bryobacteraceae bacterium]|nr:hypothetical protein [Bryobacteraceae bacterium]